MAVYDIGGARYELPDEITADQLQTVVAQLHGTAPAQAPAGVTDDDTDGGAGTTYSQVPTSFGHGVVSAAAGVGHAIEHGIEAIDPAFQQYVMGKSPQEAQQIAKNYAAKNKAYYDDVQQRYAPAVPSVTDVGSLPDAANYAASKLGEATPAIAAYTVAGPAGAAALGAATGASNAADQTGGDTAATLTGGALGAASGLLPVPFMRGTAGQGLVSSVLKGAAGNAVAGGASAALADIPKAVASGNVEDAIPSGQELADGIAGGAVQGAAFGGAGGLRQLGREAVPDNPARNGLNRDARAALDAAPDVPPPDPQALAGANQRLSQRILDEANGIGASLTNVTPGAADGAEQVLSNVHNQLAEEMKANAAVLRDQLNPLQAASLDQMMDRATAQASLRDARNKVKSTVSAGDIANMQNLAGDTAEGQNIIDLMHQSNGLTGLFRGGLKGGVSQHTDKLNPLAMLSGGHGVPGTALAGSPLAASLAIGAALHNPLVPLGQGAVFAAGRGIDALTGQRSKVARFVNQNIAPDDASPVNPAGAPSVIEQRAQVAQAAAAQKAAADAAAAQAQQAAAAEAQRLQERGNILRAQNRIANNPGLGGFDKSIYDQTGLKPHDTQAGMFNLFREGLVNAKEFKAFFENPADLMAGKAGLHIMDMLDMQARQGKIGRDPDWVNAQQQQAGAQLQAPQGTSQQPQASQAPNGIALGSAGPRAPTSAAYAAQAAGNQARVTAAQGRVAQNPNLTPQAAQQINVAIGRIGKTNNRFDARAALSDLLSTLPDPAHRAEASQVIMPLITQMRHATAEQARAAASAR